MSSRSNFLTICINTTFRSCLYFNRALCNMTLCMCAAEKTKLYLCSRSQVIDYLGQSYNIVSTFFVLFITAFLPSVKRWEMCICIARNTSQSYLITCVLCCSCGGAIALVQQTHSHRYNVLNFDLNLKPLEKFFFSIPRFNLRKFTYESLFIFRCRVSLGKSVLM